MSMISVAFGLSLHGQVQAQEMVHLEEVLPVLEGSELGQVEVVRAPRPGGRRVVKRSDVIAALKRAGHSTAGLKIPKRVTVERRAVWVDEEVLTSWAKPTVEAHVFPCRVADMSFPMNLKISEEMSRAKTSPQVDIKMTSPKDSGKVSGVLILKHQSHRVRLSMTAQVECPEQVIEAGSKVTVIAKRGNVRASVTGEARQPGRVGDIVRVRNAMTKTLLFARVINSQTVEVIQ